MEKIYNVQVLKNPDLQEIEKQYILQYDLESEINNPVFHFFKTKEEANKERSLLKEKFIEKNPNWKKLIMTPTEKRNHPLQNHLVKSYHFPTAIYQEETNSNIGDYICSQYMDRIDDELRKKISEIKRSYYNLSNEQLLHLGTIISGKQKVTGVRIVEFTHAQTEHPIYRVDICVKHNKTPKWDFEKEVEKEKLYTYFDSYS